MPFGSAHNLSKLDCDHLIMINNQRIRCATVNRLHVLESSMIKCSVGIVIFKMTCKTVGAGIGILK